MFVQKVQSAIWYPAKTLLQKKPFKVGRSHSEILISKPYKFVTLILGDASHLAWLPLHGFQCPQSQHQSHGTRTGGAIPGEGFDRCKAFETLCQLGEELKAEFPEAILRVWARVSIYFMSEISRFQTLIGLIKVSVTQNSSLVSKLSEIITDYFKCYFFAWRWPCPIVVGCGKQTVSPSGCHQSSDQEWKTITCENIASSSQTGTYTRWS